ncbi:MAG: excinuclease ABC subunit UvrA, partial [Clostridia bacterium]|nr:excinuclease ABC subunit UvrA [Clostridia bacterium]
MENKIKIVGAKENNLKNISVEIPREKLVVFTGVSGSGKSTLAFDTIFAEGQRRYIESLSSYARMFLGQSQKPDVESITGLSPSISIDQKTTNHNPRSTVGTVTEIYDYIRLLFSRVGKPYCPHCDKPIERQSIDQIVERIMEYSEGSKIMILAPVVRREKGRHEKLFESLKKSGYVRVEVDGNIYLLEEEIKLDKNIKHEISVVVDRLIVKEDIASRLTESVENALKLADGLVTVELIQEDGDNQRELYSTNFSCPECGYTLTEISPRLFSFNNPVGACPACTGLGFTDDIDEDLVLKGGEKSISEGIFNTSGWIYQQGTMAYQYFQALKNKFGIDLDMPIKNMSKEHKEILLYGTDEPLTIQMSGGKFSGSYTGKYEGIINMLRRKYKESTSEFVKFEISKFVRQHKCSHCHGKRLSSEALSVKIDKQDIDYYCSMPIDDLFEKIKNLKFNKHETTIAESIVKEILARLQFLIDVGLSYLTLSRTAETLSGGESQRIRLATQIGSGLVGVCYILDEPSIGLHQRDNEKLLGTLFKLRDLGNTLIVVEHDEDTIRSADYIVDVGPFAGVHGGEIVATGSMEDIIKSKNSITGKFLSGEEKIETPTTRREIKGYLEVVGAKEHNLKNINVKIPRGVLTCVT